MYATRITGQLTQAARLAITLSRSAAIASKSAERRLDSPNRVTLFNSRGKETVVLQCRGCWFLALLASLGAFFWQASAQVAPALGQGKNNQKERAGPSAARPHVSDPARIKRLKEAKMPAITKPVMFNTPEGDAIASALEVYPADNPWNAVVTDWPVHPNSRNLVASVGTDKPFRCNFDMAYIFVPPDQPRVKVKLLEGAEESDAGPYPVPDNLPIEGWPRHPAGQTLEQVQRRPPKYEADRHAIVIDPVNRMLYEFFTMGRAEGGWAADQASIFDLKSNKLRPDGWTSSDAAGLPIFPSIVRYDELQRGEIEHALRVTIRKSRRAYVAPATHYASPHTDPNLPRMGERFRLRTDFDITGYSRDVQTILKALKKYGMFVADNGIEWAVSIAPDPRIPDPSDELRKVKGSDFEVVSPE